MNTALWVVQYVLGVLYLIAGVLKALFTATARKRIPWAGALSTAYVRFVGIAEILGALGVVLPLLSGILPWLTVIAAAGLAVVQILAIAIVHLPRKEYVSLPVNVVLLLLAVFVAVGRLNLFA
jgi:uncharacterized membrane protein